MYNDLQPIQLELKVCICTSHKASDSIYPQDKVPLKLFRKKPDDLDSVILKNCLDCREYARKTNKKYNNKLAEQANNLIKNDSKILLCTNASHDTLGSSYSRDKVPIDLFKKNPDNPKSTLFKHCKDCRNNAASKHKQTRKDNKILAIKRNRFYCTSCHKEKDSSENALNLDNTKSTLCIDCKNLEKNRTDKLRDGMKVLKLEFMQEYGCSCYNCKNLYLSDSVNNLAIELETYIKNDIRYTFFDGKEYEVKDFILKYKNQLEFDILHFDHLTEEEQRERGLLLPDEKFIPKTKIVAKYTSDAARRLEAKKCQLLCARCHTITTINREKGFAYNSKTHAERKKLEYANSIKEKGCENCNYINTKLFRFFDFDHIDPTNKIKEISRMIKAKAYTFDEMVTEISKCRVLCHHCHMIHTKNQFDSNIISTNKKGPRI